MVELKKTLAVGTVALVTFSQGCKSAQTAAAPVPTVPVATAGPASLQNNLVLSAEFRPFQEVDVMAKVAGYVKAINVDIGDHVRQNSVLATP